MKAIRFRNIDKLFIKMSINDKIWVIFVGFLAVLTALSVGRYQNSLQQIESESMSRLESQLSGMVLALESTEQIDQLASLGVQQLTSANSSSREKDMLTAVVKTNTQKYVSLSQAVSGQEQKAKQQALFSLLLSFLWVLPFGLILYWIATFLGGALWDLWKTTEKIADGDLTSRLGFHPGRDEFGTIGCALDNAMDTLTELVVTVKRNAQTLNTISLSFASETRQSEDQINQQHISLDSVATAMEEMSASSLGITDISQKTSQQVEQTSESIKQSDILVQHAISEIQELSSYIDLTSDSVTTLKENTTKINEVITTINAISEQTNLLALNAAIEAARAGEMGRGFAVVADEVRTLASRTQSATVEIQSMIEHLQSETNNIADMTEKTVKQAQKSRELIVNIGNDVNLITESSQAVIDMSVEIVTSSEEQSAVANNVSAELSDVREKSNTIRDLAAQSSEGIVKISDASESLGSILERYHTA